MKSFLQHSIDDIMQENDSWLISEAGLSRVLQRTQDADDLVIITAYRNNISNKQNISRNRALRGELNKRKMGAYQLVGHWRECQNPNIEYSKCPKDQLVDTIERSFLVIKPDDMSSEEFLKFLVIMAKKYDQDGIVYKHENEYTIVNKRGATEFKIGTNVGVGKLGQAYSQYIKKLDVPFVFEGIDVPVTNIGKRIFQQNGVLWA
jgi:hypothetical protein